MNLDHMTYSRTDPVACLRQWIGRFDSAIVAYSGGVDSAVVLAAAHAQLGDRALGCIAVSPSLAGRELDSALALAQRLGARHERIATSEHLDPRYAANPANRCYFCKSHLYAQLSEVARREGAAVILDGTNASDLSDVRPGRVAAAEHGVRSPLAELNFSKRMVRLLARELNLPVSEKPSSPCLASRVPTGVAVTPELLHRIEQAEDVLAALGFSDVRVRHHGDVARIEVPPADFAAVIANRTAIVEGVRAAGYKFVSLDLAGLRSGSLHVLNHNGHLNRSCSNDCLSGSSFGLVG